MALHPVNVLIALLVVAGAGVQARPEYEQTPGEVAVSLLLPTELTTTMTCLSQSKEGYGEAVQQVVAGLRTCAGEKLEDVRKVLSDLVNIINAVYEEVTSAVSEGKECLKLPVVKLPECAVQTVANALQRAHELRLARAIARVLSAVRWLASGLLADGAECVLPVALFAGLKLLSVSAKLVNCVFGGQAALLL